MQSNTAGAASSTQNVCINTAITNITHITTGATGISNDGVSGANGLPAGVSATFASNTITISGTPTAAGTFNYSVPLTGGCGNVNATGKITVDTTTTSTSAITICSSELPYTWDGLTFTASGSQTKTGLTNAAGCDSMATYTLTVNAISSSSNTRTVCNNQLPYTWDGLTFTAAGTQTKTGLSNAAGCDSTATYTLILNNPSSDTTAIVCYSFTWHGVTYYHTGDKTYTTTNAAGCDSVITLHLTIKTIPNTIVSTDAVCNGSATGSITITPTDGVVSACRVAERVRGEARGVRIHGGVLDSIV